MIWVTIADILDDSAHDKIWHGTVLEGGLRGRTLQEDVEAISNDPAVQDGSRFFRIYAVRDSETVFYVGKSDRNIIWRLEEHLGIDGRFNWPSALGDLITANEPASHQWQAELMTVEDCIPFIKKHFPTLCNFDADNAEQAMIMELRPCLNVIHNQNGTPLPEKYRDRRFEDEKRKAVSLLHVPYIRRTQ